MTKPPWHAREPTTTICSGQSECKIARHVLAAMPWRLGLIFQRPPSLRCSIWPRDAAGVSPNGHGVTVHGRSEELLQEAGLVELCEVACNGTRRGWSCCPGTWGRKRIQDERLPPPQNLVRHPPPPGIPTADSRLSHRPRTFITPQAHLILHKQHAADRHALATLELAYTADRDVPRLGRSASNGGGRMSAAAGGGDRSFLPINVPVLSVVLLEL